MKRIIKFIPILFVLLILVSCTTRITKEDATEKFISEYYTVDSYDKIDYLNQFVNKEEGISIYTNRYKKYMLESALTSFVTSEKIFAMEAYCYKNGYLMSNEIEELYFSEDSDVTYRVLITVLNEDLKKATITKTGTLSLYKNNSKSYSISSVAGLNCEITDFSSLVFE